MKSVSLQYERTIDILSEIFFTTFVWLWVNHFIEISGNKNSEGPKIAGFVSVLICRMAWSQLMKNTNGVWTYFTITAAVLSVSVLVKLLYTTQDETSNYWSNVLGLVILSGSLFYSMKGLDR